jgi:hypothetical protein
MQVKPQQVHEAQSQSVGRGGREPERGSSQPRPETTATPAHTPPASGAELKNPTPTENRNAAAAEKKEASPPRGPTAVGLE